MTAEEDNTASKKKLKVIDWHMADPLDADLEQDGSAALPKRDGSGWLKKVLTLAAVAVIGVVSVRLFLAYRQIQQEMSAAMAQNPALTASNFDPQIPLEDSFVSRPKAELARDEVRDLLQTTRQTVDLNSPVTMQKLLGVEMAFQEGDKLLDRRDYSGAFQSFEQTRVMLENFQEDMANKAESLAARDDFLVLRNKVEPQRNIDMDAYERAFAFYSEGVFFLENGSFYEAHERFDDAMVELRVLESKIKAFVDRRLFEGQSALAGGNSEEAMTIFNDVLGIEEENEVARSGIKRAETLDQVYPLVAEAKRLEDAGKLVEANDAYVRAYELDNLSAKAQQGMYRTARLVKDLNFNASLVDAHNAASNGNWFEAIEAYDRALEVYPDHEEVKQLREDAITLEYETKLANALDKAKFYEDNQEWDLAKDSYIEVLDLDPEHELGKEGLLRTGRMVRVILRYEKLIELSLLEARSGEFQSAIRYFNQAMGIKPDFLALSLDAERLKNYLEAQSKPVSLTLVSDGKTWVSVAGYELLGKIREKSIRILPGKYRIVGRRKGYEDVNISVQVVAGQNLPPISVIASKKVG
jgi:tetratricopeptide (TPR) repeat protein